MSSDRDQLFDTISQLVLCHSPSGFGSDASIAMRHGFEIASPAAIANCVDILEECCSSALP